MRGVTDRRSERLHDAGQGCAGPRLPPALASSACREYEFGGLTRSVPQLPQFPSVFPLWWIAGTASVGAILSFLVLRFASKRLGLVVTYVFLGVYGAFGLPASLSGWQRSRAALAIVSFAVNVVTI